MAQRDTKPLLTSVGAVMVALTIWVGFISPPRTEAEEARAAAVILPPTRPLATPVEVDDRPDAAVEDGAEPADDEPATDTEATTTSSEPTEVDGIPTVAAQRDAWVAALDAGSIDLFGVMTERGAVEEVDRTVGAIGRQPDIVQIAVGWPHDTFDPERIAAVVDRGAMPMISWEPWQFRLSNPQVQTGYSLERIIAGDFDDYLNEYARNIAELDHPVMIRLAHEMNGNWYPWAEGVNGNGPGSYVQFWRAVVARVEQIAPDHVIWVWSPNVGFRGSTPLELLYPGDDVVDVVGVVGYFGLLPETPTSYPSFDDLFGPTLEEIEAVAPDKAVLITETSATEDGGFKAAWTTELFEAVEARPEIAGLIWFDVVKEEDWRVDSSPEALEAVRAGLELPTFAVDG